MLRIGGSRAAHWGSPSANAHRLTIWKLSNGEISNLREAKNQYRKKRCSLFIALCTVRQTVDRLTPLSAAISACVRPAKCSSKHSRCSGVSSRSITIAIRRFCTSVGNLMSPHMPDSALAAAFAKQVGFRNTSPRLRPTKPPPIIIVDVYDNVL